MKQIIAIVLLLICSSFGYAQRINNNHKRQTTVSRSKQNNSARVSEQRKLDEQRHRGNVERENQKVAMQSHRGEKQNSDAEPQSLHSSTDDLIYDVVPEMPSYPGGINNLIKYLSENINYPPEAQKKRIQGRVLLSFIVTKSGSISNVEVVQSVEPSLDSEAIRVVSSMKNWIPGRLECSPVNVKYYIPINFQL